MKGIGIDLFIATIFIGIIIIVIASLVTSDTLFKAVFGDTCDSQTRQKLSVWIEKLKSSATPNTGFTDELFVNKDCIEFITHEGIKFKSDEEVTVFTKTSCDPSPDAVRNKCGEEDVIVFEFEDERILPFESPLNVRIIPPNKIQFVNR